MFAADLNAQIAGLLVISESFFWDPSSLSLFLSEMKAGARLRFPQTPDPVPQTRRESQRTIVGF